MDVNGAQINLCELVEDYGYFPSFSGERLIWNMAVFPKTGKREVFLKSIKDLGVPVKPDCKKAPRIRQLKECFVFEKSKFEKNYSDDRTGCANKIKYRRFGGFFIAY